jgi:hypothetical protein
VLDISIADIARELHVNENTAQGRLRLGRLDLQAAAKRLDPEHKAALRLGAVAPIPLGALSAAAAPSAGLRAAAPPPLAAWIRRQLARAALAARLSLPALRPAALVAGGAVLSTGVLLLAPSLLPGCPAAPLPAPVWMAHAEGAAAGTEVTAAAATEAESAALSAPTTETGAATGAAAGDAGRAAGRSWPDARWAGRSPATRHDAAPLPRQAPHSEDDRILLDQAFAAYTRGDLAAALERLGAHASRFPESPYAGPRDRLRGRVLTSIARSATATVTAPAR